MGGIDPADPVETACATPVTSGYEELVRLSRLYAGVDPESPAWRALREAAATSPAGFLYYRARWGPLGKYLWFSRRIPGWTRGVEAVALAQVSAGLPDHAVVVEIGSFLGGGAVLLAGARKLRGSGRVYCVDPFDGSGDAFSVPVYLGIQRRMTGTLRQRFEQNIRRSGVDGYIEVLAGRAAETAATWSRPIDLLFIDGDQSYSGACEAYDGWAPFVKPGGILAVHNSRPGPHHKEHDGLLRLVQTRVLPPHYADICLVGTTTFARRIAGPGDPG